MNKKLNVLGVIALTMPLTALAGQVDSAKITAFTANTPAKAAEVNANFAEQTKQINANSGVMDQNSADLKVIQAAGAGFGGHLLKPLTGRVSVGAQSDVLTGINGALFTSELNVGDAIKVAGEVFTVAAITSDISLTLSAPHSNGTTGSAQAFVDENLLNVVNGNGVAQLTVDKSGDLDVRGSFSRRIAHASGFNQMDGLDVGQIVTRVLSVNKKQASTALRIGYTDNFRTVGQNKSCTWEIRVDGQSCPSGVLKYSIFHSTTTGDIAYVHRSDHVVGYCSGLAAGQHEIQIWVEPSTDTRPGGLSYPGSDCFTGWISTWMLEAEEVN